MIKLKSVQEFMKKSRINFNERRGRGFENTHGLLMLLSVTPAEKVTKTLDSMLSLGANVNIYMMHGCTSFGFKAGANADPKYEPNPTSYDYDAPIRNMN